MAIITSTAQIQRFQNVANSFTASRLNPHEPTAFANFINRYFSTEFCETILASTSEEPAIVNAKKHIEGMVVSFAMYQWAQTGEIQVGDLGILRTENENSKAAYSGQVKKAEASYVESGEIYLSELIRTIESAPSEFPDYELEQAFLLRDSLIIKTTKEFNLLQHMARPYLLFPLLAQQQEEAIDFNLRAILTDAIVNEFIGTIPDDTNKPAKEIALKFTKNALVNFTVANAFKKSLVKLTPQGLIENTADKDTDQQIYVPGNADKIHQQISNYEAMGNSYLSKAQNHLIINEILPAPEVAAAKTFIA
jgi:hypothetical protein